MKTYSGRRYDADRRSLRTSVMIVEDGALRPLPPRLDLINHSPTGLEWGYAGSGPAQLALALLADALGHDATATALHHAYKFDVIAQLPQDAPWQLTRDQVITGAANVSDRPLMRLPGGGIARICLNCWMMLVRQDMIEPDRLGVFDYADGVTHEQARALISPLHTQHLG